MSFPRGNENYRPVPRAPQSPVRHARHIQNNLVSMQTANSRVFRGNVQSSRFTSHLQGRFFNDTTLTGTTYKNKLEEKRELAKQALCERDRNVQLLEEEVQRVKDELNKREIERKRRQERMNSRRKRHLLYKSALLIQTRFRAFMAKKEFTTMRTVRQAHLRCFATTMIQRCWRSHAEHWEQKRDKAAVLIQRWVSMIWLNRETKACQELWGALAFQTLYRGYRTKIIVKKRREAKATIQRYARGHMGRRIARARKKVYEFCYDLCVECIDSAVCEVEQGGQGNGFEVFNLTAAASSAAPIVDASAGEPAKGLGGFSLNLAGLKDDSGKPKYSYNDEFLDKASEFSKSWRDQLERDEARFDKTSSSSSGGATRADPTQLEQASVTSVGGSINVIRGLRKMKEMVRPGKRDEILEAKISGAAKVAEIERKRLAWVREQSKKNAAAREKQEEIERQHAQRMKEKEEREKAEREKRFNDGMKKMRGKLRAAVEKEKIEKRKQKVLEKKEEEAKEQVKQASKKLREEKEKKKRIRMREAAARKAVERKKYEKECALQQAIFQEEEVQRQLEAQRRQREDAYRRRIRMEKLAIEKKVVEEANTRKLEEEEAAKKAERKEHTKKVRAQIKERLLEKKRKEKRKKKKAEKAARENLDKKLKLEEEARRRAEISAAAGVRQKQQYSKNFGKNKQRQSFEAEGKTTSRVGKKKKSGKKGRKTHSAGLERNNNLVMRAAQAMGMDKSDIPASIAESHPKPGAANRRRTDVELLPKRRKKESMSKYLMRATRVFENVAKAEAVDSAAKFEDDLETMRRGTEEPLMAFVERARTSLERHPEYRTRLEERRRRVAMEQQQQHLEAFFEPEDSFVENEDGAHLPATDLI